MGTCLGLERSSSLMLAREKLLKSFGKILYIQDGYKVSSLFLVVGVLCPEVACSSPGSWTALLALPPSGVSPSLLPPWLCCPSHIYWGVPDILTSPLNSLAWEGNCILVWFFFLLQISELNRETPIKEFHTGWNWRERKEQVEARL